MLNTVLGFTSAQIARAFAMPTSAMGTRLLRAKQRIKRDRLPFLVPDQAELPGRMSALLEAVYGAYVIEWAASGPEARALPPEGLRLAEALAEVSLDDPEVRGLAALVLLSRARTPARLDDAGRFVPLAEQDPTRWDDAAIVRAPHHLRAAYAQHSPGRFQLEAAIQALHCARVPPRTETG